MMKNKELTIKERLDQMLLAGYPIFIIGQMVCWPIESENFFTDAEKKELEAHILSNAQSFV